MRNKVNRTQVAILCLIATSLFGTPILTGTRVDAGEQEDQYEQVDTKELSFTIKNYYHKCVVDKDGGKPIGGEIGELICNGESIELLSHKFEDGYIVTKEFGKVKIRFSMSAVREGFSIWLTPSQKKELKEFTFPKKPAGEGSDPFVFNPIKKETERLLVPKQYATIQEAVDVAKDGATIVISPGVYEETVVVSNKSVKITSEKPEDANVVASTIVDANGKGVTIVLEDSSSVVLGLTIRGGYTSKKGGGIRITGKSSPLIKGNVIKENSTDSLGAGIVLIEAGAPRIVDNTIRNNKANGGGGVYAISSSIYMKDNKVLNNIVSKGGGGVWIQECKGILRENTLSGNIANAGGGLYVSEKTVADIIKNKLQDNSATVGGGIFVIAYCKLTIAENSFIGNKAKKAAGGMAIAVGSVCTVARNRFENNEAPEAGAGLVQEATVDETDNIFNNNKPENKLVKD